MFAFPVRQLRKFVPLNYVQITMEKWLTTQKRKFSSVIIQY